MIMVASLYVYGFALVVHLVSLSLSTLFSGV